MVDESHAMRGLVRVQRVFGPWLLGALVATACAARAPRLAPDLATLDLVETAPVETTLDHADLPDAYLVWRDMVAGARTSIDLEEFYVVSREGSRLEPILGALEAAADRGVKVRLLADASYAKKMPEALARLEAHRGIEVRRFDATALLGNVQHAKFFVVDGREAFLGSQNLDWRSLEHIQELGVRIRGAPGIATALADVFATDWALAGGGPAAARVRHEVRFPEGVTLVASPRGWLPDERLWDLPRLQGLIDGARHHVRVQLLTYGAGDGFDTLDQALRRAAARGVTVEVMVSDWSLRPGLVESLTSLAAVPGIAVRAVTIPEHSSGFISYARVIHAKYLAVDGARVWIGTSNWEHGYFYEDRNVGLIVDDAALAGRLDRFFEDLWASRYAVRIDPAGSYSAPRVE